MPLKSGFTLMELLVAMAVAAILSLNAFVFLNQSFVQAHKLKEDYTRQSGELLLQVRGVLSPKNRNPVRY